MNGRNLLMQYIRLIGTGNLFLCLLLAVPGPAALCAQPQDAAAQSAPGAPAPTKPMARTAASKLAAKAKKARRTAKAAPTAPEQPRLTPQELAAPYSAMGPAMGPPDNATRLTPFDPTPTARPFAPAEQDLGLKLRLGREQVLDPLTGQEVTPKADPTGAKESLKKMDVKGAVDKLGGKAEVQVEILKF